MQYSSNFLGFPKLTKASFGQHTEGMTAKPRLIAYVPKHLHAKVIALSKKQGMTQSSVIEDALAVANKAVEKRSSYINGWLIKGEAHMLLSQTGEAKKAYDRFLRFEPTGERAESVREILRSLP